MLTFEVPDMSCRSCASKISKAVKEVDPQARVEVDLTAKLVRIDSRPSASERAKNST